MGQYYQTAQPVFVEDTIYTPNFQAMEKAMLAQNEMVGDNLNTLNLIGSGNFDVAYPDIEWGKEVADEYNRRRDEIYDNFAKTRDFDAVIRDTAKLKNDFMQDMKTGQLRTLTDNYNTYQQMQALANDPKLAPEQREVWGRMMGLIDNGEPYFWKNRNKNQVTSPADHTVNYFEEFNKNIFPNLRANINFPEIVRLANGDTETIKELTKQRIAEAYTGFVMSDPNAMLRAKQSPYLGDANIGLRIDENGKPIYGEAGDKFLESLTGEMLQSLGALAWIEKDINRAPRTGGGTGNGNGRKGDDDGKGKFEATDIKTYVSEDPRKNSYVRKELYDLYNTPGIQQAKNDFYKLKGSFFDVSKNVPTSPNFGSEYSNDFRVSMTRFYNSVFGTANVKDLSNGGDLQYLAENMGLMIDNFKELASHASSDVDKQKIKDIGNYIMSISNQFEKNKVYDKMIKPLVNVVQKGGESLKAVEKLTDELSNDLPRQIMQNKGDMLMFNQDMSGEEFFTVDSSNRVKKIDNVMLQRFSGSGLKNLYMRVGNVLMRVSSLSKDKNSTNGQIDTNKDDNNENKYYYRGNMVFHFEPTVFYYSPDKKGFVSYRNGGNQDEYKKELSNLWGNGEIDFSSNINQNTVNVKYKNVSKTSYYNGAESKTADNTMVNEKGTSEPKQITRVFGTATALGGRINTSINEHIKAQAIKLQTGDRKMYNIGDVARILQYL